MKVAWRGTYLVETKDLTEMPRVETTDLTEMPRAETTGWMD